MLISWTIVSMLERVTWALAGYGTTTTTGFLARPVILRHTSRNMLTEVSGREGEKGLSEQLTT